MKKLFLAVLCFISVQSFAQTILTRDQIDITDKFTLRGKKIDSIRVDTNFNTHNSVPTSLAVKNFVQGRLNAFSIPPGVTSVGATLPLGALQVSGSPITGAGTFAFTWAGNANQQVLGDGTLVTKITNNNQLTNGSNFITLLSHSLTNNGTSGAATYDNLTGIFNVPTTNFEGSLLNGNSITANRSINNTTGKNFNINMSGGGFGNVGFGVSAQFGIDIQRTNNASTISNFMNIGQNTTNDMSWISQSNVSGSGTEFRMNSTTGMRLSGQVATRTTYNDLNIPIGTSGGAIKIGTEIGSYTFPRSPGTAGQSLYIASITGTDALLGWSTPATFTDTHFGNTDITATGNRHHLWGNHDLFITDIKNLDIETHSGSGLIGLVDGDGGQATIGHIDPTSGMNSSFSAKGTGAELAASDGTGLSVTKATLSQDGLTIYNPNVSAVTKLNIVNPPSVTTPATTAGWDVDGNLVSYPNPAGGEGSLTWQQAYANGGDFDQVNITNANGNGWQMNRLGYTSFTSDIDGSANNVASLILDGEEGGDAAALYFNDVTNGQSGVAVNGATATLYAHTNQFFNISNKGFSFKTGSGAGSDTSEVAIYNPPVYGGTPTNAVVYDPSTHLLKLAPYGTGAGTTYTAGHGLILQGNQFKIQDTLNGAGTKLQYFYDKDGAFRVGKVSGTQWDISNIGLSSFASGSNNTVLGDYGFASGLGNNISGLYSASFGANNSITSSSGLTAGNGNTVNGANAFATGNSNIVNAVQGISSGISNIVSGGNGGAFGNHLKIKSFNGTGVGSYNDSTAAASSIADNALNRMFEVGNGTADNARSNAMTVLRNGKTGLGTVSPDEVLHVVGSIKMVDGNQGNGKLLTSDANGKASWQSPVTPLSLTTVGTSGTATLIGNVLNIPNYVSGGGGGSGIGKVYAGLWLSNVNDSTVKGDTATIASYLLRRKDTANLVATKTDVKNVLPADSPGYLTCDIFGTKAWTLSLFPAAGNTPKQWMNSYYNWVNANSDSMIEGSTNKFYLDSRARGALSLTTTGTGAASYTSGTGVFNIPTPVVQSLTTSGTSGAATLSGGVLNIPNYAGAVSSLTTTGTGAATLSSGVLNIPTYTDALAKASLSLTTTGSGAATYNSSTGVFNIPTPAAAEAPITAPNTIKKYWNGYKQFVTLGSDSITEQTTNLFYTNGRARSALSLTNTGIGASTYNSSTGVFNIPNYSQQLADSLAVYAAAINAAKDTIRTHLGIGLDTTGGLRYLHLDTTLAATKTDLSAKLNVSTASTTYFPLLGGSVTGTGGAGYFGVPSQSSKPSTPGSGNRIYSDNSGRFSWLGTNGFARTFDGTGITGDRVYTLPDASTTLLGTDNTATITNKTATSLVLNTGVSGTAIDNDRALAANSSTKLATQQAVKGYVDDAQTDIQKAYALMGSTIKYQTLGMSTKDITTAAALSDGRLELKAVYINKASTITGVKWYQNIQGSYTGDNENKVALYTFDGTGAGTLTLVASSANTATLWSTFGGGSYANAAFSTPYSAQPGLYFVGLLYNSSAQTTAPTLGVAAAMQSATIGAADFSSISFSMVKTSVSALPSSITYSTYTNFQANTWVGLY